MSESAPKPNGLLKLVAFVPFVALLATIVVSVVNMVPTRKAEPPALPKSWVTDLSLPSGIETFVYGDDVAFSVPGGTNIAAPIDGFLSIEGGTFRISVENKAARVSNPFILQAASLEPDDAVTYRAIRDRWLAKLTPVVSSGTRVTKGSIIAKIEGLPYPPVVLALACFKEGKKLPPPKDVARFEPGEDVFLVHCAGCHDLTKSGNEVGPPGLQGFKDRATMTRLKKPLSLDNILESLSKGSAGMPAFEHELSAEQRVAVSKFLLNR